MKNDTFIARLARGAVASSVVGACLGPQAHSSLAALAVLPGEIAFAEAPSFPDTISAIESSGSVTLSLRTAPEE